MGRHIEEGENPVSEIDTTLYGILSTARHVEPCRNPRGPSRKAKYSLVTDSEQVPREGSEIESETVCLQEVRAR